MTKTCDLKKKRSFRPHCGAPKSRKDSKALQSSLDRKIQFGCDTKGLAEISASEWSRPRILRTLRLCSVREWEKRENVRATKMRKTNTPLEWSASSHGERHDRSAASPQTSPQQKNFEYLENSSISTHDRHLCCEVNFSVLIVSHFRCFQVPNVAWSVSKNQIYFLSFLVAYFLNC